MHATPCRRLFVNFLMGNSVGRADDTAVQTKILRAALDFAVTAEQPGVLPDFPLEWHKPFVYFAGEATPET